MASRMFIKWRIYLVKEYFLILFLQNKRKENPKSPLSIIGASSILTKDIISIGLILPLFTTSPVYEIFPPVTTPLKNKEIKSY